MKKILSLLSVLAISGTTLPTTIAASPYEKQENKLESNSENLIRSKRYISDCESGGTFWNKKYYCSLLPEVWEEISILFINNVKFSFGKISNENQLFNLIGEKLRNFNVKYHSFEFLHTIIFSFNTLNNEWQKSDKKKRIRIEYSETNCRASFSSCEPRTHLEWFNIRNNETIENNKYVSRLERDLKIFNLNIIRDEKDETILNAIKEKNPDLDISKIEIDKKNDYSHFSKIFSVVIKVKNGDDYYSQGTIKNNIIFNTEIKLKELSDKIKNDPLFVEWLNHINDYNINLPTKINNLKEYTYNQKLDAKNVEKEIIKVYIRNLNQILRLIENEWKINELNNTVKDLKSDIDNLKSDINKIDNLILNLNNEKNCKNSFSNVSSAAKFLPVVGNIFAGVISIGTNICKLNNA